MIRQEVRDEVVLWITFDAPESLNAFTPESMAALGDAWRRFRDDDDLLVAVVRGAGERSFSVGSNLKTFIPRLQSGEMHPAENQEAYQKGDLGYIYKPIIAAVNGECLGGGLELLTCTDIRLSAPHARFGLPEPRWGVFPGGGGTTRLPRQMPYPWAMDILLTGRMLDAEEALRLGLINRIVPAEQLDAAAQELALEVASNGSRALRAIKESVLRGAEMTLPEAYLLETEIGVEVFKSDQAQEGLAAFAEKREPSFRIKR
ncbi:MAG TPA: enoyl-CoA hydratase/isomerase family protein [Solirubrobacteraceae bacterium]|jgi:enoyl-CoA hydratase/carnithine racemase|nr:enoyl-CoA hydratase/isomerase family protein [Solirubrobacteraceae bacterium]